MTSITFHAGVDEIGGNKFLLEDRGTRVLLDFGMQMGRLNRYFTEFLSPRKLSGMGDLFEFGLLPEIEGIYRRDYSRHSGRGDHGGETSVDGVLLTHAHVDHCAYIHYLRPEIPVYCSEASRLIMKALQETGGGEEYVAYRENFKMYENSRGGLSRARSGEHREEVERDVRVLRRSERLEIDSISVEPIGIDHSLPGVYGFLIHTSEGDIGYTADIRFHGRRPGDSQDFVDRCGAENLDYLLCEGTRIDAEGSITEFDVEDRVAEEADGTKNLVVCTYPARDLDRLLSFYNAARRTGRELVIDTKQAYLLKLFAGSDECRGTYPTPTDPHVRIFVSRKGWGLLDGGRDARARDAARQDYKEWEREFLDHPNRASCADVAGGQGRYMFYCSDYQLQNLIDVRPKAGSKYIRSSTEPFDDEMALDEMRVREWMIHFGLVARDGDMVRLHVSGHGTGDQIKRVVEGASPRKVIPIHTEKADMFRALHGNVRRVSRGERVDIARA